MAGTDGDRYGQDADERQRRDYRALAGAVGGALLILLFACLLWWLLSQRAEVPDVTGMAEDKARVAIEKAGFEIGEVTTQTALPDEAGLVLDQSPDGGHMALKGSDVALVVAGQFAAGTPGSPGYVDWGAPDTDEAELVLPPAGGDGAQAADVGYYVAPENLGPQVPNVQGMTGSAAKAAIISAGFGCAVKSGASSTGVVAGQVYYQYPAPGEYVPRGAVVTIWVSSGDSPSGYVLPDE